MAYALKGAEYMGKKDMTNFYIWVEKMQTLQKKYNVSEKNYEEICNVLVVDMDFMNAVQKRVTEL